MKKLYVAPNVEFQSIEPDSDVMWNGAGKEEGMLTNSWRGGIPTDEEDYEDSDKAKQSGFLFDEYIEDFESEFEI